MEIREYTATFVSGTRRETVKVTATDPIRAELFARLTLTDYLEVISLLGWYLVSLRPGEVVT